MTTPLQDLLLNALDGDDEAVSHFLISFLETTLYVPDRHQTIALTNQPSYPSALFAMMGVQDGARTIIPCFCSEEALQRWTSSPLACSSVRGLELCKRAPEQWWLVLDPGEEASKEFSPWEIAKLRQGAEAIPEIVADLAQPQAAAVLEVEELDAQQFPMLREAILTATKNIPSVTALYLAREHAASVDGDKLSTILVGFLSPRGDVEAVRNQLQERCNLVQIGDEQVRVIGAASADTLQFSVFTKLAPFWEKPSILARVIGRIAG